MVVAYNFTGLHLGNRSGPWHGVAQVCNEQGLLGRAMRVQGPSRDQVGPGRRPHTHTASTQVRAMAVVQRGQGGT
jgi:hypothetical protein